jgi:hypothetical protein
MLPCTAEINSSGTIIFKKYLEVSQMDSITEAYYQGAADYESLLAQASYQYSPEEEAYYQGAADYEAAVVAQSQGGGNDAAALEQAYYQGAADYEAALAQALYGYSAGEEEAYYQGALAAQALLNTY